jgi:hypothetical protein
MQIHRIKLVETRTAYIDVPAISGERALEIAEAVGTGAKIKGLVEPEWDDNTLIEVTLV